MNELIINGQVSVTSNFEDLKRALETNIKEKYDIAVTDDNVKEAKQVMAQINKDKKEISDKWRVKKQELEAPIKEVDSKVKELLGLYDNARMVISNQVDTFEASKRELAVTLCKDYANQLLESKNLKENCTLDLRIFDGFNNLTYVSDKGALTSVAKQAVENEISKYELEILRKKQEEAERILREEQIKKEAIERFKQEQEIQKQMAIQEVQEQKQEQKEIDDLFSQDATISKMERVENAELVSYKVVITCNIKTNKGKGFVLDFVKENIKPRLSLGIENIEVIEK